MLTLLLCDSEGERDDSMRVKREERERDAAFLQSLKCNQERVKFYSLKDSSELLE